MMPSPPAGGFGAGGGAGHFGPIGGPSRSISSDRLAVTALVLGALSLPMSLCLVAGLPLGLGAVAVSIRARRKIQAHPDLFHGERTAKTGFWFGVVGLLISALYITFNLAMAFLWR